MSSRLKAALTETSSCHTSLEGAVLQGRNQGNRVLKWSSFSLTRFHYSRAMAIVPRLPPELVSAILANVPDKQTLVQCAVVSRVFYYAARTLLWRTVVLHSAEVAWKFDAFLLKSSGPLPPVTELVLVDAWLADPTCHTTWLMNEITSSRITRIMKLLQSRLTDIRLETRYPSIGGEDNVSRRVLDAISRCPNLTCLSIRGLSTDFGEILAACPYLRELVLEDVRLPAQCQTPQGGRIMNSMVVLPHIRRLRLQLTPSMPVELIDHIQPYCDVCHLCVEVDMVKSSAAWESRVQEFMQSIGQAYSKERT